MSGQLMGVGGINDHVLEIEITVLLGAKIWTMSRYQDHIFYYYSKFNHKNFFIYISQICCTILTQLLLYIYKRYGG
mgnify:CR=1 FL=1